MEKPQAMMFYEAETLVNCIWFIYLVDDTCIYLSVGISVQLLISIVNAAVLMCCVKMMK